MGGQRSGLLLFLMVSSLMGPSLSSASDDAACLAGSKAYAAALLTHDSSPVPFHPLCTRIENGIVTGVSGPELAFDLNTSPVYRVIKRIYNENYVVDNGLVISSYLLDSGLGPISVTVQVNENFTCEIYNSVQTLRKIVASFSLQ